MNPGEKWLARGFLHVEPESVVTIMENDPEDTSVDVQYEDGSERLLPRHCLIRRVEEPRP